MDEYQRSDGGGLVHINTLKSRGMNGDGLTSGVGRVVASAMGAMRSRSLWALLFIGAMLFWLPQWAPEMPQEKTLIGRIAGMILKMPLLRLDVTLRDGTSRSFRILPAAAAHGFLLSPVVDSRLDFLALNVADLKPLLGAKQVVQIAITPQRFAAAAYRAEVPIAIEKFHWTSDAPPVGIKLDGEVRRAESLALLDAGEKSGICQLDFLRRDPEMFAHAASRIIISAPPARQMTVRFGIHDGAWQNGNHTDGVEFRISAMAISGSPEILWSRRLTPVQRTDDRGDQEAVVNLPSNPGERLVFETLPVPGGTTSWAWSYWKSLEFGNQVASPSP